MGKQIAIIAHGRDRTMIADYLEAKGYVWFDSCSGFTTADQLVSGSHTIHIARRDMDIPLPTNSYDEKNAMIEMSFGAEGTDYESGKPGYTHGRIYLFTPFEKTDQYMGKDYERIVRFVKSKCARVHKYDPCFAVYILPVAAKYISDHDLVVSPHLGEKPDLCEPDDILARWEKFVPCVVEFRPDGSVHSSDEIIHRKK